MKDFSVDGSQVIDQCLAGHTMMKIELEPTVRAVLALAVMIWMGQRKQTR